jgi:hypothetical protein
LIRNPKQNGSNLYDCVPQTGPCPIACNQCFFNRGYYRETPFVVPDDGIVRMNCGHDSNIQKSKVLEAAKQYKHVFFNTSIANFDFPGPVVFTANAKEPLGAYLPVAGFDGSNIMAVRLRVSSTNLHHIKEAVSAWKGIPVILTFMAYCPEGVGGLASDGSLVDARAFETENYIWQARHVNSYWCPKPEFIKRVVDMLDNALVFVCGKWCKDCGNCEKLYWRWRRV